MIFSIWRIVAVNNTGVALAAGDSVSVNARIGQAALSNGAGSAPTTMTPILTGGASLAAGATLAGSTQNPTPGTNFVMGGDLHASASISTATPNGTIDFYLQFYDDSGAGVWPTAGASGIWIGSLSFTATGTQEVDFSLGL